MRKGNGVEFTIGKSDGVRLQHDRKSNGVRFYHEKEQGSESLSKEKAMG